MVILDFPFVSDYMQESLVKAQIPVIRNKAAKELKLRSDLNWITEETALSIFRDEPSTPLYTNSENAISWINTNLSFTDLPQKINLFKDKVKFRRLISSLYPDFFFKDLSLEQISKIDPENIPYPLILKPAVGFFSLGVYKLNSSEDWQEVIKEIQKEANQENDIYPDEVYNSTKFILEECIPGREFAIDAYFNEKGEASILNITEHYFSSEEDLSDRLYQFRPEVFQGFYSEFLSEIQAIGSLARLRTFPIHIEIRITPENKIIPIEVNPLRFGGWCTTADLAGMAFSFNPYELFHKQQKPDWDKILSSKAGKAVNLILLDNVTGLDSDQIKGLDYDKLKSRFKNVLEVRKVDFRKYPIFGFMFVETDKDEEPILQELLRSDLREYLLD